MLRAAGTTLPDDIIIDSDDEKDDKLHLSGRCAGLCLGSLIATTIQVVILTAISSQAVHYAIESAFVDSNERRLEEDQAQDGRQWRILRIIDSVAWLLIMCGCFWGDLFTLWCYWRSYIRDSADKYLPEEPIIPDQYKGSWKFGIFDCSSALGTCCCFWCCPGCSFAELWYRMGWIHKLVGPSNTAQSMWSTCPGFPWFYGIFAYMVIEGVAAEFCCAVFVFFAMLRNGARGISGPESKTKSLIGINDMSTIYGMPEGGGGGFFSDCCTYCCCLPCIATQEFRQVMAVLNSGPIASAVVGQPVQVGAPVQIGQPIQGQASPPEASNKVAPA